MSLPIERQSLSANQILSSYLNSRLRHNYFRCGKTNVRHTGITSGFDLYHFSYSVLFCMSVPNFVQIGPCIVELWRHVDFQDGGSQPCCICFGVMVDHPRSAFRGLNCVFKSLVRRINSFGDIAMYRFWRFGCVLAWNCLFTLLFGEFLGHIFPYDVTHRPDLQQNQHVVWAIQRKKNQCDGSIWACEREKYSICNVKCGVIWGLMETGSENSSSKVPYLESPTLICLFTVQLLWGYDDD